jgi:ribosomal protein S6
MQFRSEPPAAKELDRQLKLHEDVLRGIIVRLDAKMKAHMAALAAAVPPPPAQS